MMRIIFFGLFFIISTSVKSQLSVEKIMQNPNWIGTSPSNIFWSSDSKKIYFNWNPDKNLSDSIYVYSLTSNKIVKANFNDVQIELAKNAGVYNNLATKLVYSYKDDIYLFDLKENKTIRVTQTEDAELNPKFIDQDQSIVFTRNQNLFAWSLQNGSTKQLTNFTKKMDASIANNLSNIKNITSKQSNISLINSNNQDLYLQQQSIATSDVLKLRKERKDKQELFLKSIKDADTLLNLNIGDKVLQNLQINPNGNLITYRLFTPAANTKIGIVPDFVTESGYTTAINNRAKVGAPHGYYEFYVYNKAKATVTQILVDSLPGYNNLPDFYKDYKNTETKAIKKRDVFFSILLWNKKGDQAIFDIRSQDNKDRWIVSFNSESEKMNCINWQHDNAWIDGPGISSFRTKEGWINENTIYFQSEVSGYSHLYSYNFNTFETKPITKGNFEVEDVQLSNLNQYFYLLTNEQHPGKQNWYRIKTDGSEKQQITSFVGGYEISMSPNEKQIAYRYSFINKPWELFLQENETNKTPIKITDKAQSDEFKAYPWRETKIFSIKASDGLPIYAKLYEPKAGLKNNAAVIFVHGAGYLQNVHYWWSNYFREYMFNNLLADKGFTVLDIDYRASSGYGRNWRTGIYRFMGGRDLDDEVDAVKYLVTELGIDSNKIGMYGGSYGGFITLMAMFTKPDLIKAGAALRPVTDWAHYNQGYTSNILNEPINDSIAYARSSPINFVNGLKNHLLICHGMIDLNVNFQDAVRLNQRLIELGKNNWSMAVYPLEDHGFIEPSSWIDEYKRILNLFETWLK